MVRDERDRCRGERDATISRLRSQRWFAFSVWPLSSVGPSRIEMANGNSIGRPVHGLRIISPVVARSFRGQTIVIDSCKFQQSPCPPTTVPFADSAVSSPPLSQPKFVFESAPRSPRAFRSEKSDSRKFRENRFPPFFAIRVKLVNS